jgi:cytochrome c oxidase cbb3-type subunit 4
MALLHSLWTLLLLIIFVGIVVWAWSGKRKRSFEQAARLPLEDEEDSVQR